MLGILDVPVPPQRDRHHSAADSKTPPAHHVRNPRREIGNPVPLTERRFTLAASRCRHRHREPLGGAQAARVRRGHRHRRPPHVPGSQRHPAPRNTDPYHARPARSRPVAEGVAVRITEARRHVHRRRAPVLRERLVGNAPHCPRRPVRRSSALRCGSHDYPGGHQIPANPALRRVAGVAVLRILDVAVPPQRDRHHPAADRETPPAHHIRDSRREIGNPLPLTERRFALAAATRPDALDPPASVALAGCLQGDVAARDVDRRAAGDEQETRGAV